MCGSDGPRKMLTRVVTLPVGSNLRQLPRPFFGRSLVPHQHGAFFIPANELQCP